jgi:2'-5' RNA ligase
MALAIVSELDLEAVDTGRIEELRRRHDPQQSMVAAHFTLVFPFEGPDQAAVEAHAEHVARAAGAFSFHLRCAAAVQDPLGPLSRLFLLPEAGNSDADRPA